MYAGDFNNKVINHISWMKVVMKVCLSEMYLSFMYISCHYYCVIVRIFKNILYQSIARSMCSYIVYSLHYNHCIISLLPPFLIFNVMELKNEEKNHKSHMVHSSSKTPHSGKGCAFCCKLLILYTPLPTLYPYCTYYK